MNTVDNLDLSKPDAAAQKLAPTLEAGYKTFSAATWALRLWKWVVRPVARIAVGTMRGVWWLLKNGQWSNGRQVVKISRNWSMASSLSQSEAWAIQQKTRQQNEAYRENKRY